MIENIKTSIVQTSLSWEDVDLNLSSLERKLGNIDCKTDIVVLPEMFASGFTMKGKENIAHRYCDILLWMRSIASKLDVCIAGTTIYKENDRFYNRFLFVKPEGSIMHYDKRHLFTMGEEKDHFFPGSDKVIIDYKGWRIRPFVCYDLRFPVWNRNRKDYDIAIYSANWPETRRDVWITLLKARAIENQAYVVGVNCVGEDGMNLQYSGDSVVYDAKGRIVCSCEPFKEEIKTVDLSYEELLDFRNKFPVLNDADDFKMK